MSTQSYANHAHQPRLTIAAFLFWVVAVVGFVADRLGAGWGLEMGITGVLLVLLCLISISRAYTTALQDRIILVEERWRAERLLSPGQLAQWDRLGVKQVVALRFASDAEFAGLFDRTLAEALPPKAIKQAIRAWRPDLRRT